MIIVKNERFGLSLLTLKLSVIFPFIEFEINNVQINFIIKSENIIYVFAVIKLI